MVYLNTEDPVIIPLTEGIAAFKALESSNHSFLHYFHSFLVHKATTSKRQCAPSFIFDSVPGNSPQVPFPISLLLLLTFTPFGKTLFLPLGFSLCN